MNTVLRKTIVAPILAGLMLPQTAASRQLSFAPLSADNWLNARKVAGTSIYHSFQATPVDPAVDSTTQFYAQAIANTYDNALVGLWSLASGQAGGSATAKSILSYYSNPKNETPDGLLFKSNVEFVVSSGELIWMGMLAAQYDNKTTDHQFEPMMRRFDTYILDPSLSVKGGLRGGPSYPWVSTEHNIDALSYLQMRYKMLQGTDPAQAQKLRARELQIAQWIVNDAYIPSQGRLRRGENDNVFASDTHFLAINFLTQLKNSDPAFYASSGLSVIDLPKLMRYAESQSKVTNYAYKKPDGSTAVITGFRYTDTDTYISNSTDHHSPISLEWTAMAARAYDALGETANAAEIRDSLVKARIINADGSQCWAYATNVGSTFQDGWIATAYPAVASTMWSSIALGGVPANWPLSFTPIACPPGRCRPPRPQIPSALTQAGQADANPILGDTVVVSPQAPSDSYIPVLSPKGNDHLNRMNQGTSELRDPRGLLEPQFSSHDIELVK